MALVWMIAYQELSVVWEATVVYTVDNSLNMFAIINFDFR